MGTWQDAGPCSVEDAMVVSCGLYEPVSQSQESVLPQNHPPHLVKGL